MHVDPTRIALTYEDDALQDVHRDGPGPLHSLQVMSHSTHCEIRISRYLPEEHVQFPLAKIISLEMQVKQSVEEVPLHLWQVE